MTPADRGYSNAARAGRTSPGKIEIRDPYGRPMHDGHTVGGNDTGGFRVRHGGGQQMTGRQLRRARGYRIAVDLDQCRRPADRARRGVAA